MQTHKLVLPEHLNHYDFLFGGNMLKWVDEVAWIAASIEFPSIPERPRPESRFPSSNQPP